MARSTARIRWRVQLDGTLFSFDPVAKTFTTLASFGTTTATGQRPTADLINVNGTLYGTTSIGGSATHGTLFSYNPATTTFTTLASFGTGALSGLSPDASVIDVNGMLYRYGEQAISHFVCPPRFAATGPSGRSRNLS